MSRFRPSLQLVILGPALGLILIGGIVLYLLVLRTISSCCAAPPRSPTPKSTGRTGKAT
jgi:hypothetical protein